MGVDTTALYYCHSTLWRSEIARGHGAERQSLGLLDDDDGDDDDEG